MDDRALIQHQLAISHRTVKHAVADIAAGEAGQLQAGTLAPVVWHVGHLAWANRNFVQRAGVTPTAEVPAIYHELFKTGSGGAAAYPSLDEVVRIFDATHEGLLRVVSEAGLDTATEGPRGVWNNFGEMFSFADAHRWYHIGKLTSLRALLGKPRLFG